MAKEDTVLEVIGEQPESLSLNKDSKKSLTGYPSLDPAAIEDIIDTSTISSILMYNSSG